MMNFFKIPPLKRAVSCSLFNVISSGFFFIFFIFLTPSKKGFEDNLMMGFLILLGIIFIAFTFFTLRRILLPTVNPQKVEPLYLTIRNEVYRVKSLRRSSASFLILLAFSAFITINVHLPPIPLSYLGIAGAAYHCLENLFLLLEIPKLFSSDGTADQNMDILIQK